MRVCMCNYVGKQIDSLDRSVIEIINPIQGVKFDASPRVQLAVRLAKNTLAKVY